MQKNSKRTTRTETETKIPGFRKTSYHPLVRVIGFVVSLIGIWLIAQDILSLATVGATLTLHELVMTLLLAVVVTLMIVMFVFEVSPVR